MLPHEGAERFRRAAATLMDSCRACDAALSTAAAAALEFGIAEGDVVALRSARRELNRTRGSRLLEHHLRVLRKVLSVSRAAGETLPPVTERMVQEFAETAEKRAEVLYRCAGRLTAALDVLGAVDLERASLGEDVARRTALVAFASPDLAEARLAAFAVGVARRTAVRASCRRTVKVGALRLRDLARAAAPGDGEAFGALGDLAERFATPPPSAKTARESRAQCLELHEALATARGAVTAESWDATRRRCRTGASAGWKAARRALRAAGERSAARAVGVLEAGARGEDGDSLPAVEPLGAVMEKIGGAYGEWLGWPDAAAADAAAEPVSEGAAARL